MGTIFRNLDLCFWDSFSLSYGVMADIHILERPSLMRSWFPISSCHFRLSAFHSLQAMSLKALAMEELHLMKQHGNRDFQVWLFLLRFVFQYRHYWSSSPSLCNQKGLGSDTLQSNSNPRQRRLAHTPVQPAASGF